MPYAHEDTHGGWGLGTLPEGKNCHEVSAPQGTLSVPDPPHFACPTSPHSFHRRPLRQRCRAHHLPTEPPEFACSSSRAVAARGVGEHGDGDGAGPSTPCQALAWGGEEHGEVSSRPRGGSRGSGGGAGGAGGLGLGTGAGAGQGSGGAGVLLRRGGE